MSANAALVCFKSVAQRNKLIEKAAPSQDSRRKIHIQRATIAKSAAAQSGCAEKKMRFVRRLTPRKRRKAKNQYFLDWPRQKIRLSTAARMKEKIENTTRPASKFSPAKRKIPASKTVSSGPYM